MSGARVPISGAQRGKIKKKFHVSPLQIQCGVIPREEGAAAPLWLVQNAQASREAHKAQ